MGSPYPFSSWDQYWDRVWELRIVEAKKQAEPNDSSYQIVDWLRDIAKMDFLEKWS